MSKLVSVQDISCFGQCSLTVALPVLSSYGIETAILPSGILSAHTGCFPDFTFLDLTEEMSRIVDHWKKNNLTFDAIYTGYIGDHRQFELIRNMKCMLNPGGKLIVDPAMADHGALYPALDESIVNGMRDIIKDADLILPNLTEASFLLGDSYKESYSWDEYVSMAKRLSLLGPETVILTGVLKGDDLIGALAYEKSTDSAIAYYAPRQKKNYPGTGDVFSSVLIGELLGGASLKDALMNSCNFIVDCIQETLDDDSHFYGVKFEKVLAKRK